MNLKPPSFWNHPSLLSKMLFPLSWVVSCIGRLRHTFVKPHKVSVPVICVGNVTIGGTGKTPLVIALVTFLKRMGHVPHILSRGYGAKFKTPLLVDSHTNYVSEVGDEPLLLAKVAPTWVYPDRRLSAELAIKNGATILLMDDGFQNPKLHKDLHLLVIDGKQGFGNGQVLPSGPLREPLEQALDRADALIVYNASATTLPRTKPVFTVQMFAEKTPIAGRNYIAFAGIGNPQKFFDSLSEKKFPLLHTISYPDHFAYNNKVLEKLLKLANQNKATLITTEKDALKIPVKLLGSIEVFPIQTQFDFPESFEDWLKSYLKN